MAPTSLNKTWSFSNQDESKFFQLPLEVRRCIYDYFINKSGYHVVSSLDGELSLTPCLGARLYDGDVGDERNVAEPVWRPDPEDNRRYQRRLRSSWGPHWMCEEFWIGGSIPIVRWRDGPGIEELGMDISSLYPVLKLCKKMYEEVIAWATAEADFHVTDLDTLAILRGTSPSQSSTLASGSYFCLQALIAKNIEKLAITLSRPLACIQALETRSILGSGATLSLLSNAELLGAPVEAHSSASLYADLPRLRKLLLWLDHTGQEYWSVVNERAILAPFITAAADYPLLDFMVVLPKTHPTLENSERHFLDNTLETSDSPQDGTVSPPSGTIRRVWRQRWRVVEGYDGCADRCQWYNDFPHLLRHDFSDGQDMDDVERMEAKAWRQGVDMKAELKSIGYRM